MHLTLMERILYFWPQPVLFGLILAILGIAWRAGIHARRYAKRKFGRERGNETHEGYVVSGALGLLALLLGFTFSMAVDRFERRRILELEEGNAISSTYLMAQTFELPQRERIGGILSAYVDNRLAAARSNDPAEVSKLTAQSAVLQTQFWAAALSATATSRDDVASRFLQAGQQMIESGTSRVANRRSLIPTRVHLVLIVFMVITAGVLGFTLVGAMASIMLFLLALSMILIIDLDRPTSGAIVESQRVMEDVQTFMRSNPPAVFDLPPTAPVLPEAVGP
jgi:hypothetical protein